jgi:hypothetical protein
MPRSNVGVHCLLATALISVVGHRATAGDDLLAVADIATKINAAQRRLLELPTGWTASYVVNVDTDVHRIFAYRSGLQATITFKWPMLYSGIDGINPVYGNRDVREGEYNFDVRTSVARANDDVHVAPNRHMWTAAFLFPLRYQFFSKAVQYYYPGSKLETSYWLPEALQQNQFQIAGREVIGDTSCIVLRRDGYDALWVAPDRGYVVLKRELSFGPTKPRQEVVLNEDLREVAPGIWWPFKQVRQEFSTLEKPSNSWNKIALQTTLNTLRFTTGPIADAQLHITIPDGARVTDLIKGISYVRTAPGQDPLRDAVDSARKSTRRTRSTRGLTLVLFNASVILGIVVFLLYRRLRTTC